MSASVDNPSTPDEIVVDVQRRRFLTTATTVVGAAGAAALGVQFLGSMSPSARALAAGAPVEADISLIEAGAQLTVEWRGKPVWIVNRTDEMLATLGANDGLLKDPNCERAVQPDYARNEFRSREQRKNFIVLVGICTHLGCSPAYVPDMTAGMNPALKSGWECACHGSAFDIAGRVTSTSPAATNLEVPPYQYLSDGKTVLIGEDSGASA